MDYYRANLDLTDSGLSEMDPFEDTRSKEDYDSAKKQKYLTTTHKIISGQQKASVGSFMNMVKSGEVHISD